VALTLADGFGDRVSDVTVVATSPAMAQHSSTKSTGKSPRSASAAAAAGRALTPEVVARGVVAAVLEQVAAAFEPSEPGR
jgi:hypothetical protein